MEKFKINKNYLKFLCPETMNFSVFIYIFQSFYYVYTHLSFLKQYLTAILTYTIDQPLHIIG